MTVGLSIAYLLGGVCIVLPRHMGVLIAEALDWITKHKYGAATSEQKQVRPAFSVLIGIVVLALSAAVHHQHP